MLSTAWETPLHAALRSQNFDVVELLVKNGADVNVRERSARWPRMLAPSQSNNSVPGEKKKMTGTSCRLKLQYLQSTLIIHTLCNTKTRTLQ
jgi:ankyrin repeat protein